MPRRTLEHQRLLVPNTEEKRGAPCGTAVGGGGDAGGRAGAAGGCSLDPSVSYTGAGVASVTRETKELTCFSLETSELSTHGLAKSE